MNRWQTYIIELLDEWEAEKAHGQITINIKGGTVLDLVEAERLTLKDLPYPALFEPGPDVDKVKP